MEKKSTQEVIKPLGHLDQGDWKLFQPCTYSITAGMQKLFWIIKLELMFFGLDSFSDPILTKKRRLKVKIIEKKYRENTGRIQELYFEFYFYLKTIELDSKMAAWGQTHNCKALTAHSYERSLLSFESPDLKNSGSSILNRRFSIHCRQVYWKIYLKIKKARFNPDLLVIKVDYLYIHLRFLWWI